MSARLHHHLMTDDSSRVDVHVVLDDDTAHTGHMRVDAVPVADPGIMTYYRIGLNHIVIPHHGIIADDGVCSDEITLAQTGIRVDARRLVNQFQELPTPSDYLFHTNQNMELYDHLFNFYMFLRSGEEQNPVNDDVKYFKENDIQVGANPEILMMLMYLIDVHTQQNMPNAAQYFKNIFNELAEFTKYLNHL